MHNLKVYEGVNWNRLSSDLAETFWKQQMKQFWLESDIAVSKDILQWKSFEHKEAYKRALGGLTLLDTIQSNIGMNQIGKHTPDLQEKSLYSAFSFFEAIHAKSYSRIFTTLCTNSEVDELFEWVKTNKELQYKANKIVSLYEDIEGEQDLYKAMFASVMLESFLFFSGFFYPLYLAGQGVLKNSGEIINLIIRDEALHGVAVGMFSQNLFNKFDKKTQDELKVWGYELLLDLYSNECKYTEEIYAETGLSAEVKKYVRYNANKSLMNLGWDTMFEDEQVNPIVLNGIRNESVTHDFFSQKGTYTIANVEPITDETFNFNK